MFESLNVVIARDCNTSRKFQVACVGVCRAMVRIQEEGGDRRGRRRKKEAHLSNAWNAAKKRSPSILFSTRGTDPKTGGTLLDGGSRLVLNNLA